MNGDSRQEHAQHLQRLQGDHRQVAAQAGPVQAAGHQRLIVRMLQETLDQREEIHRNQDNETARCDEDHHE
ncbi:hypothetical protein SDC9_169461 [bioreactor metagenome]|uniref:Uncharacterized protein n=1 Tax=bioreactor metagenome TaxID=1076179 RepID=A0A645G5E3_9ZZZZ